MSSAFILYGMSFLYGISGTTNIAEMAKTLPAAVQSYELLLYMAVFFLIAGFGFKISAAPFHNWAPDVYQGPRRRLRPFWLSYPNSPVSPFYSGCSMDCSPSQIWEFFIRMFFWPFP
nr:proton-conducting transporter membrane subunit [Paenibacillus larvae]